MPHADGGFRQFDHRRGGAIAMINFAWRGQLERIAKLAQYRVHALPVVFSGIDKEVAVHQNLIRLIVNQICAFFRQRIHIHADAPVLLGRDWFENMADLRIFCQKIGVFLREKTWRAQSKWGGEDDIFCLTHGLDKLRVAFGAGLARKHYIIVNDRGVHLAKKVQHAGMNRTIPGPAADYIKTLVVNADIE